MTHFLSGSGSFSGGGVQLPQPFLSGAIGHSKNGMLKVEGSIGPVEGEGNTPAPPLKKPPKKREQRSVSNNPRLPQPSVSVANYSAVQGSIASADLEPELYEKEDSSNRYDASLLYVALGASLVNTESSELTSQTTREVSGDTTRLRLPW